MESCPCPYCYGSPAVVCCGLCGSAGVVSAATARIYNRAKIDGKDTLHLRIELRKRNLNYLNQGDTHE